jgi:chemotaxis protein methyltransferase WspC
MLSVTTDLADADSGKLEKAKDACRNLMRQHEENVEVQFMMGLISETAGEWASASQYFRKVLYLHPEHQEALLHSAIVCEYQDCLIASKRSLHSSITVDDDPEIFPFSATF